MGIIDSAWVTLSCKKCNVTETQEYNDHGSMWSGSWWNDIRDFSNFKVQKTTGGRTEPKIVAADCLKCGESAEQDHGYS